MEDGVRLFGLSGSLDMGLQTGDVLGSRNEDALRLREAELYRQEADYYAAQSKSLKDFPSSAEFDFEHHKRTGDLYDLLAKEFPDVPGLRERSNNEYSLAKTHLLDMVKYRSVESLLRSDGDSTWKLRLEPLLADLAGTCLYSGVSLSKD